MGHVILPKFVICAECYAGSAMAASEVTTGKIGAWVTAHPVKTIEI
jgi:hypothetical protein